LFLRSIPAADGTRFVTGTFFWGIDHRTPIENRWGGWYVTGTHGSVEHMGNAVALDPDRPLDLESGGQNLTSLAGKFDTTRYLAPTSDIVVLMTLEHQTRMTNFIVAASQQFRRASQSWSPDARIQARLDAAIEDLVAYMLFAEEAPLRDGFKGVSSFTQTFSKRGPHDRKGRSLLLQAATFHDWSSSYSDRMYASRSHSQNPSQRGQEPKVSCLSRTSSAEQQSETYSPA
jgi:hypothetical protein